MFAPVKENQQKVPKIRKKPKTRFNFMNNPTDEKPVLFTASEGTWEAIPTSIPVTIDDVRYGMCRWPIGDSTDLDSFRFCGAVADIDHAYCHSHRVLGTVKMPTAPYREGSR